MGQALPELLVPTQKGVRVMNISIWGYYPEADEADLLFS
jgi:hypothetical protein